MTKYSTRGGVEGQIQHLAKPRIFATRPNPSAVFYCTTQVYNAFIDLLVLHGRIDCLCFELGFGRVDSQPC